MNKISEAIYNYTQGTKTEFNADLVDRWSVAMETQGNVAADNGEPVDGKRSTYADDEFEWWNFRIPKNAADKPTFRDYNIRWPLDLHIEGLGMTGWDWKALRSRWVGFDFDSITGHAKGVGISEEELERVKEAAEDLPYVEVRKSTGGGGIHLYVYFVAAKIELLGPLDEDLSEVGVDAPVALMVGVSEVAVRDRAVDAHVIEFGLHHSQARLDFAQAVAVGQLCKGHDPKLFGTWVRADLVVAAVNG